MQATWAGQEEGLGQQVLPGHRKVQLQSGVEGKASGEFSNRTEVWVHWWAPANVNVPWRGALGPRPASVLCTLG